MTGDQSLLAGNEPAAYELVNAGGKNNLLLVCDHASNRVPANLHMLGLNTQLLASHIGWDPGAAAVARMLSARLDAPLLLSNYSRLVVDCNRWPSDPSFIPETSDGVVIPGNAGLTAAQSRARRQLLFEPYQAAVAALLHTPFPRQRFLLSIHSFTPTLAGLHRPWCIGVCYRLDVALARRWLIALKAMVDTSSDGPVGDNEPYEVEADCDYTIPVQGESHGVPGIMLEIRQDKIADQAGARKWSDIIAEAWITVATTTAHR